MRQYPELDFQATPLFFLDKGNGNWQCCSLLLGAMNTSAATTQSNSTHLIQAYWPRMKDHDFMSDGAEMCTLF